MAFRDLISWNNQGRNIVQRSAYVHPFLALHREIEALTSRRLDRPEPSRD